MEQVSALTIHEAQCSRANMIPGDCDCDSGRFWWDPDPEAEARQLVQKTSGDYRWPGWVVGMLMTHSTRVVRIVVESRSPDTMGALHIFAPSQLKPVPFPGDD